MSESWMPSFASTGSSFNGRDAMQPMLPNYSMVASDPKCAQRCLLLEATSWHWQSDLDSESEVAFSRSGSALEDGKDSESQTPTRSRRRGFPGEHWQSPDRLAAPDHCDSQWQDDYHHDE
jgi:hypothetical protein